MTQDTEQYRAGFEAEHVEPCPWCGNAPDVSNDAAFRLTDGAKYGALQCCGIGPEVRTDYKDTPHWRGKAIKAWNDRTASKREASTEPSAWVAVADRLPPEGEPVLTHGSKRVQAAVMQYTKLDTWQIETASEWHAAYAPTHWMSLPPAPGEFAAGALTDDAKDAAIETMDHDQLGKLGQHYANGK